MSIESIPSDKVDQEILKSQETNVAHLKPEGSSGTKIYGEIYNEEYLRQLTGTDRADKFDEIVRSDDTVTMLLTARKNPILRASWEIEPAKIEENQELADKIAEHVKHEIFERMDQDFHEVLEDQLSFIEQGWSMMERVHQRVSDPKWGDYVGFKKLAWRSQRTIDRWELDTNGNIISVFQQADGDLGSGGRIDGRWITVFTHRKKGDNYEGISALRPIFGNWQRKNIFLKLLAIGIERYAIQTPVGTIPTGFENQASQVSIFREMLKSITSHQKNWLTKNAGWDIEFLQNNFDVDKMVKAIVREDEGMVKSFVANHLNLGSGGSGGAYALGNDFSESFLSIIENDADIFLRRFNKEIIREFVDFNYGKQSSYPKLKVSGINDKIGAEFAEVVKKLIDAKIITATSDLEEYFRKVLKLPSLTNDQVESIPDVRVEPISNTQAMEFSPVGKFSSEDKSIILTENEDKTKKLGIKIHDQISRSGELSYKMMQKELNSMTKIYINKLKSELEKAPREKWSDIIKDFGPMEGAEDYKLKFQKIMVETASRAITQAKDEVPNGRKIKLYEGLSSRITLAMTKEDMKKLGVLTSSLIERETELIANKQIEDFSASILLSASGAIEETDNINKIVSELNDTRTRITEGDGELGVNGSLVTAGNNSASKTYNSARNEFFTEKDILSEVEAFIFSNPNPKSPICQNLTGRVFTDYEASRNFTPPLHHNCKSFLVPLFDLPEGVETTKSLRPTKKGLEKYKTL